MRPLRAQPAGGSEQQGAGDDRPGADQMEEGDGGDRRPDGDHAREAEIDGALEDEHPPARAAPSRPRPREDGEEAVRREIGGEEKDERRQRRLRHEEDDDDEDDRREAAQRNGPPVRGENRAHRPGDTGLFGAAPAAAMKLFLSAPMRSSRGLKPAN